MTTRFDQINKLLEAIVPTILELPVEVAIPLLLQLSREGLLH